jgi:DNA-binding MarR family transcriptional regulator
MAKQTNTRSADARAGDAASREEKDFSTAAFEAFIINSGPIKIGNELDRRIAIYLIQRISKAIHQGSESIAAQCGIHVSDFYIILLLHRAQPDCIAPASELQRALTLTSGGMTRRLDRLEERGLLERIPDPADRRAWLIRLTKAGKALAQKIRDDHKTAPHSADGDLTESEWKALGKLLQKLSNTMHHES